MSGVLGAFVAALAAAYGVFLVVTDLAYDWRGVMPAPRLLAPPRRSRLRRFAVAVGAPHASPAQLVVGVIAVFVAGVIPGYVFFGGALSAGVAGVGVVTGVISHRRGRLRLHREIARETWPRLIEEIRLRTVTMGRSIPRAVFDVGDRAPGHLRAAFAAAHREWLISTDFGRSLAVLKASLADPTADAVCETLLVAYEVGGTDVDARLRDLADDRTEDLRGRKDARAKQAGARFARNFVVIVPMAMALVGLQLGDGRAAFQPAIAQLVVVVAFAVIAACWVWAGALLRLPDEGRVFADDGG